MIGSVFSRIAGYGRTITVTAAQGNAVTCRGFLPCADTMAEGRIGNFQAPGVWETARHLLLAAPEAVAPGHTAETVSCGSVTYEVLGLQPVWCGETLTHWEGVLRKKEAGT